MPENRVIPFGKYKGRSLEEVGQRDPQYLAWLTQQAWFVTKFHDLNITINNFGAVPEDTPAHNAMQVRFLDFDYRCALLDTITLGKAMNESMGQHLRSTIERAKSNWCPRALSRWERQPTTVERHREAVRKAWSARGKAWAALHAIDRGSVSCHTTVYAPEFETESDVAFLAEFKLPKIDWLDWQPVTERRTLMVEIKPDLGDDFPAVLRQIKRQQALRAENHNSYGSDADVWTLLVGRYDGGGATLAQVRQVFKASGINVVLADEIEACLKA